jgi:molybdopterin converting factor small subunit
MSMVELRYFAAARAALGRSGETLAVAPGVTVRDVVGQLAAGTPAAEPVLARCAVLLDGRRAEPGEVVPDGARLDLLPPFAGG